eukprot:764262-Hanusia_phi.AAC.2
MKEGSRRRKRRDDRTDIARTPLSVMLLLLRPSSVSERLTCQVNERQGGGRTRRKNSRMRGREEEERGGRTAG